MNTHVCAAKYKHNTGIIGKVIPCKIAEIQLFLISDNGNSSLLTGVDSLPVVLGWYFDIFPIWVRIPLFWPLPAVSFYSLSCYLLNITGHGDYL